MPGKKQTQRQRVAKAPVSGMQNNTIKQEPIFVSLKLQFSDPEGVARPFPKDFEIDVRYGQDEKTETAKIVGDAGILRFTVSRADALKFKHFRLVIKPKTNNYLIFEKRGDAVAAGELGDKGTADERAKDGKRFFRLPSELSMLSADWNVTAGEDVFAKAPKEKKFLLLADAKPRSVGTKAEPVEALLNPHWQFLKFEYFDRYYGHSGHDDKPISAPAMAIAGSFDGKETTETKMPTRSNWTIAAGGDEKKLVQCLPWFAQADEDGTPKPRPDKESVLQFTQPKHTYVIATSATDRKLKSLVSPFPKEDGEALSPCAKRLTYYDLPELWKSKNYFCRLSDLKTEQGFFEKMADRATTKDKPLIFSLDDVVLTNDKLEPLKLQHTDKVVLFFNEFLDPTSDTNKRGTGGRTGAKYWKNGLYKPGLNLVEIKAQAAAEKPAREKAEQERRKREEEAARAAAETKAENAKLRSSEIKKAGDAAVLAVATDKAAQKRIKEAGEKAGAQATKEALAAKTITTSTENINVLRIEHAEAGTQAETKQTEIEENAARAEAVKKQTKIEEDAARRKATDTGKKNKYSPSEVASDVTRAVAGVATDKDAQERIKKAGDDAVAKLKTDAETQARIQTAKKSAEAAHNSFPYSDVKLYEEVPNYISDYPHWTRLVVYNGNLFDNFDQRTTTGDVIGARAAVRWADTTVDGVGFSPNTTLTTRPDVVPAKDRQSVATHVIQPLFEQQFFSRTNVGSTSNRPKGFYDEWNSPLAKNDSKAYKNSRSDLSLLRTSNFKDTAEENVVFRYIRMSFDFEAQTNDLKTTATNPDMEADQIKWTEKFVRTAADRWNGNDDQNAERAWIVEDSTTDPKLRAQVVTFIQEVPKARAHFHVETIVETGTSSMNSADGTGVLRPKAGASVVTTSSSGTSESFAGAHEIGHCGGQPDDYAKSEFGQTGFGSNHTTGTPYILDRRAMMKGNNQVRTRSFWHVAEWLRQLEPFGAKKFEVKHGTFVYKVPHYNHNDRPGRNYVHWNLKSQVYYDQPGDPILYDTFLYLLGKDEFSQNVLTSKPDGILVVMLKMYFKFTDYTNTDPYKKHIFNKINQKISNALNNTPVHAQFNLPGVERGDGGNTFEKCLIRFSPRFGVSSSDKHHLGIEIKTPPSGEAAKNWYYQIGSAWSPAKTEMAMHGLYNAGTIDDGTTTVSMTGTVQGAVNSFQDQPEFESQFYGADNPRLLDFRFPPNPGAETSLSHALTRFQNFTFKSVCHLLGLSDDSGDANYYQTADAYKSIVRAAVNDDSLNPTMTRG